MVRFTNEGRAAKPGPTTLGHPGTERKKNAPFRRSKEKGR